MVQNQKALESVVQVMITDEQATVIATLNNDIQNIERYRVLALVFLPLASDYCNTEVTLDMPQVQVFVAKAVQYYTQVAGLTGRTMGSVSYTYTETMPDSVYKPLKPLRKVAW